MTYTINGKEWTKADINKRCAELEGKNLPEYQPAMNSGYNIGNEEFYIGYNPCNNWNDAGPIIEKCFDELNELVYSKNEKLTTRWNHMQYALNCTKQTAACICYIEINEASL
jgi:hypothetical protein